jgi:hypothetical protein
MPREFTASYLNWVSDIQSGFLAAAWGVGNRGRAAVAVQYLDFGDFRGYDWRGIATSDFGASDFAVAVHGAGRLRPRLQWGLAAKLITESIDGESSTAFAADGGLLYQHPDRRTQVGLAIRNAGAQTKALAGGKKDDLPLTLVAGFSHHLRGAPFMAAADIFKRRDDDVAVAAGIEYTGIRSIDIRAGYNSLTGGIETGSDSDDFAGVAFGAGFEIGRILIDYAFGSLSELGDSHRFTLRSSF